MGRLDGKVAVIAGGTEGVGRGIALRLAHEGASVVVIGLDKAKADFTMRALAAIPADAKHLAADPGSRTDVEQTMQKATAAFGRIDILVNALEHDGPAAALEDIHDEQLIRTITRELHVPLWTMRAALPCMKQQGGGHIINVVSLYGDSTWRAHGDYHAASEAMKALTRTAAEEWGPHGILVNAIMPAADTPAYQRYRARHPERTDQLVRDSALGRMGDPERDIGGAAMLLVSDAGRFLTGHMIYADGGQHLTPSPYEALILLSTNLSETT